MPNIQFNYVYRDGGNYKNYGFLIFNNLNQTGLKSLNVLIKSNLIDGQFFFAKDWKLPNLHFEDWDNEIDHNWQEFKSFESTCKPSNTLFKLAEFTLLNHSYHFTDIGKMIIL